MTSPPPAELAIEARALVKRYGDKLALDGVDLEVPRGQVCGLLGPNGAGKTTAVRILTTLTRADSGTVRVAGIDAAIDPIGVRECLGLAAQDATVDGKLTGFENLVMIGELRHLGRRAAKTRATQLLEQFSLTDAAKQRADKYSGGMRRRLDLAATLVGEPAVLFLDEPTTGLDPRARNELWEVLDVLVAGGATILLTTQYLEEADRLADEIVMVDHGKVIARGDSRTLKRQVGGDQLHVVTVSVEDLPAVAELMERITGTAALVARETRTVSAPVNSGVAAVAALASSLQVSGIAVEDLGLRQPTLDDAFLALTGKPADLVKEPT
ncbi:MAG: ATP-binding cassette domain-containing protein [Sporichthyaceae bacterium]